jgi:GalNAc-alpha-(1->4)-GalNAc-alpha-(1->3)-diNAcBac-PP-undecaprenol alpha-1,4-N-acetyl-D-galactosaminyltransferase
MLYHATEYLTSSMDSASHSGRLVAGANLESTDRKPPSIVLVTGAMDCGGAQRDMACMANYWAVGGWRVTLATWSGPEIRDFFPLAPGVARIWLNVGSPGASMLATLLSSIGQIYKFRRWLRAAQPDAVLSFIDVSNVYAILAALGLGVRVVVSERTNPRLNYTVSRPWRALRRMFYARADIVVAQTRDAAHWIERKCRVKVVVIPNGLRALPEGAWDRQPEIIAVGRLSKEKGFDVLLKAFAQICSDFRHWRLSIIGEGPERLALTQLRDQLNLTERVTLVGQVQDVEMRMACAGLVVHPSRREGFPNVVLEAMGSGAAVICADCPSGPSELIQDGINGRLVPVDDVATLARVMSELMASPHLRGRLGLEASKVRQHYAQSVIMDRWEACLLPELVSKS